MDSTHRNATTAVEHYYASNREGVDVFFARVGRDGLDELRASLTLLQDAPLLQQMINAVPVPIAVLNGKGQTLLTNRCWIQSYDDGVDCALGKRHGELLHCVNSTLGPDGCGTSRHCDRCGAAVSLLASRQSRQQTTCEYRLHRETAQGVVESRLIVISTAILIGGESFYILVVQDLEPSKPLEEQSATSGLLAVRSRLVQPIPACEQSTT